ncbi:right-handed parallel beta-helix repeat-containing protein [Streptomyces sp. CA-132043]|uniref:right-handed parallel beta-helix repeat-containing protein n=1 Tax=Streptomyces sp. CA-132043 TaxID=3240048 RepID=UPI003D9300B6
MRTPRPLLALHARPLLLVPVAALAAAGTLFAVSATADATNANATKTSATNASATNTNASGATNAAQPPAGTRGVIDVSTAAQLKDAMSAARPGDTIQLADGTYRGNFKTSVAGSTSSRITLTGSSKAVLTASGGYGLHLNGASYWTVKGLTITGGQKGIMADAARGVVIDSVTVHGLDMEGVHFRHSSKDGVIKDSRIYDTGRDGRGMGEGVYVGGAGDLGDNSDNVEIRGNTIGPDVGGENIDIKEGTTGAKIIGNTFDGSGLTGTHYDDSWVDVKGNDVLVENNTGTHTTNNGYETHTQQSGWGCGTVFRGNKSDLSDASGSGRYGFNITNYDAADCPVTITGDNTVTGGRGIANPGVPVN